MDECHAQIEPFLNDTRKGCENRPWFQVGDIPHEHANGVLFLSHCLSEQQGY
jgi:hypothetical protein